MTSMKNVSFKVKRSRRFLTSCCILSSEGCKVEPQSIRVAAVTAIVTKPDGKEFGMTHEFASYDTDIEHFKDFIGHIKFKLREIFENAETTKDLIAAFNERFVKNDFHSYYIMDIK